MDSGTLITFALILAQAIDLNDPEKDSIFSHFFTVLVPLVLVTGFIIGTLRYLNGVKHARRQETVLAKLKAYKRIAAGRLRIFEAMFLVSIVGLLATSYWIHLAMACLVLVLMLVTLKGKKKISEILRLSEDSN